MFFLRSAATLRKSDIQRLEPILTAPSNTPLSYHENEDSEYSQSSTENIQNVPQKNLDIEKVVEKEDGVEIIFSKIEKNYCPTEKNVSKDESTDKLKVDEDLEISPISSEKNSYYRMYFATFRKKLEDMHFQKTKLVQRTESSLIVPKNSIPKQLNQVISKKHTANASKKKTLNRYKHITSRVDTGRKRLKGRDSKRNTKTVEMPQRHCLAIQTSNTVQDGSGDTEPKKETDQQKLERFRRINMKIIEAVSKTEEYVDQEPSTATEDYDSDIESLEELEKEMAEEEMEEKLNEDALKACQFLNKNYPNYFQHLIVRYQLDVATKDLKELRMRKLDIIRIAADEEEKLMRLENMYREKSVRNPVLIFCD